MQGFLSVLSSASGVLWGPGTLGLFMLTGTVLSVRSRFFQFTHIRLWLGETFGSLLRSKITSATEGITQAQALWSALAACVGTGNIVGVATAICSGGEGAVFWMLAASGLGMMTCCSENILGIMYREKRDGEWLGGPMGYLEKGLGSRFFAKTYGALCSAAAFGIGSMTQANSVAESMNTAFSVKPWVSGLVLTVLCSVVILGGVKRIATAAEKIIPPACAVYILFSLFAIIKNIGALPKALAGIFTGAFKKGQWLRAMRYGVSRGVFSNEAGLGTSAIIHSCAETDSAERQGMWGIFEVFTDTPVMCTLTALVVLCSGAYSKTGTLNGASLTQAAFSRSLGATVGNAFLSLSLCVFAFATVIGWCCYAEKAVVYLLGKKAAVPYRIIYLCTVFIGSLMRLEAVWELTDILNVLMAFPNLLALLVLSKDSVINLSGQ